MLYVNMRSTRRKSVNRSKRSRSKRSTKKSRHAQRRTRRQRGRGNLFLNFLRGNPSAKIQPTMWDQSPNGQVKPNETYNEYYARMERDRKQMTEYTKGMQTKLETERETPAATKFAKETAEYFKNKNAQDLAEQQEREAKDAEHPLNIARTNAYNLFRKGMSNSNYYQEPFETELYPTFKTMRPPGVYNVTNIAEKEQTLHEKNAIQNASYFAEKQNEKVQLSERQKAYDEFEFCYKTKQGVFVCNNWFRDGKWYDMKTKAEIPRVQQGI